MPWEPARRVLAAAVTTGALSAENTNIVIRCPDTLNRIPTDGAGELDQAEHDLTSQRTGIRAARVVILDDQQVGVGGVDVLNARHRSAESDHTDVSFLAHDEATASATSR